MKVFVAGGSGAVGRRLVPQLVAGGYEVVAMARDEGKASWLRRVGAQPVVADALDGAAVAGAVEASKPEVVIHQLTALAGVSAAHAAGVRRIVAQSYGNWNYERTGSAVKTEQDPFDPHPPANQVKSLQAIRYVENAVVNADGIEGIALRYGNFYGPGTDLDLGRDIVARVRKRQLPIVGDGAGIWSFAHVDDAAAAAIAAIEHGSPGVYNVADDEPAPVAKWLPDLAAVVGAKPPRHVPAWLGRLAAGEVGVSMMTQIRGTLSAKAKAELGWSPRYRTYREGFRDGLGDVPVPGFGPVPAVG